jgi:Holliday junction resolvase-like predicted endonuclease
MVNKHKQKKIIKTAEFYLYSIMKEEANWRIDVITVRPKSHFKNGFRVGWIKNAVTRET